MNSLIPGIDCKSVVGTGIKLNILEKFQIYNQVETDRKSSGSNSAMHFSCQAGAKYFNAFTLENLFLQAEYNTSQNDASENTSDLLTYSHYSQPLAHPLGINFKEWVIKVHYNLKSWQLNSQFNFTKYGSDTINTISNEYKFQIPFLGNGQHVNLFYNDINIAYLINPKTNMRIESGFITRNATFSGKKHDLTYFYITFRTSLTNWYYDF
jgi:hypothetical protein